MNAKKYRGILAVLSVQLIAGLIANAWTQPPRAGAGGPGGFAGKVQGAGSPIAGSTVALYAAGDGGPTQFAQAKTGDLGTFNLDVETAILLFMVLGRQWLL